MSIDPNNLNGYKPEGCCRLGYKPYSLNLKIETVLSFEMLVNFYLTTRHYVPENSSLHSQNLNSNEYRPIAHQRLINRKVMEIM
jgi:hypothetical protein